MIFIENYVPTEYHRLIELSSDGVILTDINKTGKEQPWLEKKVKSQYIAKSYKRIGNNVKYKRLKECGTYLEFKRFKIDNSLKLNKANFCKVRLCPICSWRRSLKIFGQVSKIMDVVTKEKDNKFIFLTLTIRNCKGSELTEAINKMMKGYKYIFERTKVKNSILGSFRALEITHNTNKYSKSYDTYHPHFHCILMVNKSYFHKDYIKQNEWAEMWQQSIDTDYLPIVHIEKVKSNNNNIQKAVAEVAKYSVKDSDILNFDTDLQDSAVKILDDALANRRLISVRGEFLKIQKQLKLDDAIDGDLIHCDGQEDDIREDVDFVIEKYKWFVGYNNYIQIDVK